MNRRQALKRFSLLIIGAAILKTFYHVFEYSQKPSLSKLNTDKIKLIVNTILPERTDQDLFLDQITNFVIKMVKNCTGRNAQKSFLKGLNSIDDYCQSHFSNSFIDCTVEERTNSLNILEETHYSNNYYWRKISSKIWGDPFIITIKRYAIIGYCTSEIGATKRLNYDALPGGYEGCVLKLNENTPSWATR